MRGAIERLAPLAKIYLAGVSYDPFVATRLSMLYRLVPLDDRDRLTQTLAAVRPVVTSQVLGSWLTTTLDEGRDGRGRIFSAGDAAGAVEEKLATLPTALFVDPELRANPRSMVQRALALMVQAGDSRERRGSPLSARRTTTPSAVPVGRRHRRLSGALSRGDARQRGRRRARQGLTPFERGQTYAQGSRFRTFDATVGADDAMRRDEEIERRSGHRFSDAAMA